MIPAIQPFHKNFSEFSADFDEVKIRTIFLLPNVIIIVIVII